MKYLCQFIFSVALFAGCTSTTPPVSNSAAPRGLVDGARSETELVDRYLAAINAKDEAAMHQLRVSEGEYLEIIVPGTVKPGSPPRAVSAEPAKYFWSQLDTKSRYRGQSLLEDHSGHKWKRLEVSYTRPDQDFAWYSARGEVRIDAENEAGQRTVIRSGWIAKVGDRYKFIGFDWDE